MTKKILMLIIGISVLVCSYILLNRYKVEERNSYVEIAVDMTDFQDLAGQMGVNFSEVAQDLKNAGTTSLAVHEVTPEDLKKRGYIAYMPLGDLIMGTYSLGAASPIVSDIVSGYKGKENTKEIYNYSVVITQNKDIFDFLNRSLGKRTIIKSISPRDNSYAIIIQQKVRNLGALGLGFYEEDLKYAKSLGFLNLIPRMQTYPGIDEEEINYKIDQVKRFGVSTVVFAGETVIGYDADVESKQEILKYAARQFQAKGLVAAIIEKPAEENINKIQRGITAFSKESQYTSTKVFSVDLDMRKTYDPRDIVDQWSRAIAERNTRVVYVRPILNLDKEARENLKDNLAAISSISQRIKAMGLQINIVKGLGKTYPQSFLRLIIFAGIIAGGLLILLSFDNINSYFVYGILGLGVGGSASIFINDMIYNIIGDLTVKAAALAGAIIFPSLASLYLINVYSKYSRMEHKPGFPVIITKSVLAVITAVGIALIGGFMVASLLAESKYLLKIDIFRGVKLAFVLPMVMFIALYIKKIGVYSDKDDKPISVSLQLKKLLNTSVTVKYVLAGGVVLLALVVLLLRSGNAPVGMSSELERSFRTFLETVLIARPRSKELLVFPILMLLVYASIKRYKTLSFFIMFAGVVGLADIVNTFSHLRMSLELALRSTVYSLTFGLFAGIMLVLLWNLAEERYFKNLNARRETH